MSPRIRPLNQRLLLALAVLAAGFLVTSSAAASTVTVGQVHPGDPPGDCSSTTWVPISVAAGGASYTVPAGYGVITAWHTRVGFFASTFKLKVLRPTASPTQFTVVVDSAAQALPTSSPAASHTFPMRVSVQPGDLIGLRSSASSGCSYPHIGSQIQQTGAGSDLAVGATATLAGFAATDRLLNVAVTVESDADGDGFGDDTQDGCATDSSTQGACPASAPSDTTAPTLTALKVRPKSVRVRRSSRASAAAKRKYGAKISYQLSEDATVTHVFQRVSKGWKVKGKCSKKPSSAARSKRCNRYRKVGSLSSAVKSGVVSTRFSGKIKGKALARGNYRLASTAKDSAGNSSTEAKALFRVTNL